MDPRTNKPFDEALSALLDERGISQRKLAQLIDVNPSHLSRVLNPANAIQPSAELIRRVTEALGLPHGYFAEARETFVTLLVHADSRLRDELYDRLWDK